MVDIELQATDASAKPKRSLLKRITLRGSALFIASAMFCVWQMAFVIFSLFLGIPEILPELWVSYQFYDMPVRYFVLGVSLIILPTLSVAFIVWLVMGGSKDRVKLVLKFFYGFELPALLILCLYLLNMRDYGIGLYWLLLNVAIAMLCWLALIVHERINISVSSTPLFATSPTAMAGSTMVFAVGAYVSVALLLFVVPTIWLMGMSVVEGLVNFDWTLLNPVSMWHGLRSIDWPSLTLFEWSTVLRGLELLMVIPVLSIGVLALTSFALVGVLPLALIYLYVGQFIARIRQSMSVLQFAVASMVLAVMIGVHFMANKQSQQAVFALLENDSSTESAQRDLASKAVDVREGLLNAYLVRYRYLSSVESADILSEYYSHVFSMSDEKASIAQKLLNVLFKPLIYDGNSRADVARAEKLYEQYFDAPIQKAEVDAIWDTLNFNNQTSRQNAAGLLDVSEESVYVESQSIDVGVEDKLATVRITQKLVNKERRIREAVVHFSLPDSSVITGVWLSDKADQLEQHVGLVAPRGAAQEVYKREVSRRIDPALLEKVGPDLYRLRVYPILGARRGNGATIIDGAPMYVTFEFQTLANAQGTWPMPVLLEKRHLYWDANTKDTINGNEVKRDSQGDWIPAQAALANNIAQAVTQIPADLGRALWAVPRSYLKNGSAGTSSETALKNVVVLVDGSRSMERFSAEVMTAITNVDGARIYFCKTTCERTSSADLDTKVFWGNSKPINQLAAFLEEVPTQKIDSILVLSDDGSYEAELDTQEVVVSPAPVWVLHLGGSRPYAYSDAWLTSVNQSGGGFATDDMPELLLRITLLNGLQNFVVKGSDIEKLVDRKLVGLNRDWLWFDAFAGAEVNDLQTYAKLGAAMDIGRATKTGETLGLELLDFLHRQAIQANIITELSSMIVLVNDEQKRALKEASEKDDRFDRENETGVQVVGSPGDALAVAAVPEPHEWALLLIVMMFVSMSLYRRYVRDRPKSFYGPVIVTR